MQGVFPLVLLILVAVSPGSSAWTLGGTLYVGGNWADIDEDAPVLAAGDLLELPDASAQGTLQLLPRFDLGPVRVEGELWGEVIAADDTKTHREGHIQRLTGGYDLGSGWLLSVGAQLFHTGTSYVWNPSNPFTDPNVNNLDRAYPYHREGDPFAAVEWLGAEDSVAVQVVDWLPTDRLYGRDPDREISAGVRWEHIFASADVAAVLARRDEENFASVAGAMTVGERLELHAEAAVHDRRRTLLPLARTVALPGGNTTFYELSATDWDATVGQILIGGQYTFPSLTNVILEYFYNGEGYTDGEFHNLEAAVAAAEQDAQDPILGGAYRGFLADVASLSGRMRRHYLFGRIAVPDLVRQLDVHLFLRWGFDDDARVAGLLVTLPMADGVELRANVEHFEGPDSSEIAFIPFEWRGSLALACKF